MEDPRLVDRVFEVWDKTVEGEYDLNDIKKFRMLAETFRSLVDADVSMARAENIRTETYIAIEEHERKVLSAGKPPLELVAEND